MATTEAAESQAALIEVEHVEGGKGQSSERIPGGERAAGFSDREKPHDAPGHAAKGREDEQKGKPHPDRVPGIKTNCQRSWKAH